MSFGINNIFHRFSVEKKMTTFSYHTQLTDSVSVAFIREIHAFDEYLELYKQYKGTALNKENKSKKILLMTIKKCRFMEN